MEHETKPLVTVDWVMKRTCFSKGRVYQLARERVIPCVRFGRQIRFDRDQVESYIANNGKTAD